MEVIELDNLDFGEPSHTSNYGSGIELFMNDKVKSSSHSTKIDLGDLNAMENEMNELSSKSETKTNSDTKSIFGISNPFTDSKVGNATAESIGNTKTWDGFAKMSEVPNNDNAPATSLNDREKRRKKRAMIKNLELWHEKGILKSISRFTMDSSYEEVEDEYESALEDKRKRDSVKIQQNWLITMINTIEYGNAMFDPFGVSLDGWGESISEDIDSYDEIFEQLHEKYKGGKMSPELSLLMRLGFSASVVHFSNKALSTAAPGFNDVIKQSPELMRMFTNATVDSMKQTSPGMAFASELLKPTVNQPPPAPVETRNYAPPPPSARPGMQFTQNRPDINMGRGMEEQQPKSVRQEMSGPKNVDINNILSGLKTKTVDISNDEDSRISISSLTDINNNNLPRKARRNKSDKNVISLDI